MIEHSKKNVEYSLNENAISTRNIKEQGLS